jgi:hypothetical protein
LACGDSDRGLVSEHLAAHHGERLGLGGVHLPGHDRGAWLILRQDQFAQAGPRAGAEQPDVIGDLEQARCDRGERSLCEYDGVVGCERLELVRRGHEGQTCEFGDLFGDELRELRLGIEPGSNRSAASLR